MVWCRSAPSRRCPPALPELAHALNTPGDLAQQFDEILNLSATFAPLLPLDPAVTLYAPLTNNLADFRGNPHTFARDTSAVWRRDDGHYFLVPSQSARFEDSALLMEPARSNKCTNWNADVDEALVNLTVSGNGVMTRQADDLALTAAGLDTLVGSFVVDVDNTAGGGTTTVTVGGLVGNTNIHALSVYARNLGGDCHLQYSNGGAAVPIQNTSYERVSSIAAPNNANVSLQILVAAGGRLRFVLNGLVESAALDSPIVTQGASGTRGVDSLEYGNWNTFFSQAEGMAGLRLRFDFDPGLFDAPSNLGRMLGASTASNSLLFVQRQSTNLVFVATDGPSFSSVSLPVAGLKDGAEVSTWTRWRTTPDPVFQLGIKSNGAWQWGIETTYDGAWPSDGENVWYLGLNLLAPFRFSQLTAYDTDYGRSWVEANCP